MDVGYRVVVVVIDGASHQLGIERMGGQHGAMDAIGAVAAVVVVIEELLLIDERAAQAIFGMCRDQFAGGRRELDGAGGEVLEDLLSKA